jgi:hypothetical protein
MARRLAGMLRDALNSLGVPMADTMDRGASHA